MIALERLASGINDRTVIIGVIGLGYVGLPVACTFAEAGFDVIGVDIDSERVQRIAAGESPIEGDEPGLASLLADVVSAGRLRATTDYRELKNAGVVTINVQTPVAVDQRPDYSALQAACESLGTNLGQGTLVIVESTVSPGTSAGRVTSTLEKVSGMQHGQDFFVGACPERVMPGKLLSNIKTVPRVAGGPTPQVAETMRLLYSTVVDAEIDCVTTTTAELVKVVENTYRDVQIAFANEVALVCADLDEDVWTVRDLVNKVPFRDMHLPGGGVGGHCIPKDPWLLASSAITPLHLIPAARGVNDAMPRYVGELAVRAARALAKGAGPDSRKARRVLVLGYAYLPESDDTRNSPSQALVETLEAAGLEAVIHDPHIHGYNGDVASAASDCGLAVLMVPHRAYAELDLDISLVIDVRHLAAARRRVHELEEAAGA